MPRDAHRRRQGPSLVQEKARQLAYEVTGDLVLPGQLVFLVLPCVVHRGQMSPSVLRDMEQHAELMRICCR